MDQQKLFFSLLFAATVSVANCACPENDDYVQMGDFCYRATAEGDQVRLKLTCKRTKQKIRMWYCFISCFCFQPGYRSWNVQLGGWDSPEWGRWDRDVWCYGTCLGKWGQFLTFRLENYELEWINRETILMSATPHGPPRWMPALAKREKERWTNLATLQLTWESKL